MNLWSDNNLCPRRLWRASPKLKVAIVSSNCFLLHHWPELLHAYCCCCCCWGCVWDRCGLISWRHHSSLFSMIKSIHERICLFLYFIHLYPHWLDPINVWKLLVSYSSDDSARATINRYRVRSPDTSIFPCCKPKEPRFWELVPWFFWRDILTKTIQTLRSYT